MIFKPNDLSEGLFSGLEQRFQGYKIQFGDGKWLEKNDIFLMEVSGISPKEI